ncbi:Uncharacterised protein [Mycobacterium tuberculosis]|nr:Uncharacterised protein [Mycobacterium tuberculosis]
MRSEPSALYSASMCIGGNMPSAYQSRCPEVWNNWALSRRCASSMNSRCLSSASWDSHAVP